jgi:hypothetical protein
MGFFLLATASTGALSLGIKWLGHEADHSPPSSAEVKNAWSYISTSPTRLRGVTRNTQYSADGYVLLPLRFLKENDKKTNQS